MPARKNVTQILIGKSERSRWFEMLHGSVVRDLMRDSGAISVTAVAGAKAKPSLPKTSDDRAATTGRQLARLCSQHRWRLPITVLAGMALRVRFQPGAGQHRHAVPGAGADQRGVLSGCRPRFVTAIVSVMAYNFFFLPPLYTFTIADPNNWLSFGVFCLWRCSPAIWRRGCAPRPIWRRRGRASRANFTSSPASWRALRGWTTFCGQRPFRSPRC